MYNGILACSLNLEKKLRRRKGAIIIEKRENITKDILQKMLDKHIKITKVREITKPLKYRWYNPKTREIIITVKNSKLEFKEDLGQAISDCLKSTRVIAVNKGTKINL